MLLVNGGSGSLWLDLETDNLSHGEAQRSAYELGRKRKSVRYGSAWPQVLMGKPKVRMKDRIASKAHTTPSPTSTSHRQTNVRCRSDMGQTLNAAFWIWLFFRVSVRCVCVCVSVCASVCACGLACVFGLVLIMCVSILSGIISAEGRLLCWQTQTSSDRWLWRGSAPSPTDWWEHTHMHMEGKKVQTYASL